MKFVSIKKQYYRYYRKINAGKQHNIFTTGPCTIVSKINVSTKGVYLPISKLHSILSDANLRVHNKLITQIKFVTAVKFHLIFTLLAMLLSKRILIFASAIYEQSLFAICLSLNIIFVQCNFQILKNIFKLFPLL